MYDYFLVVNFRIKTTFCITIRWINTNSFSTSIFSFCITIKKFNFQSTYIKITKMTLSIIRLLFCFANNDNRMTPPSGLQFFSKCEPDGVPSDCHLLNKMTTGWHPSYQTHLLNNIIHEMLININNCLPKTWLKL